MTVDVCCRCYESNNTGATRTPGVRQLLRNLQLQQEQRETLQVKAKLVLKYETGCYLCVYADVRPLALSSGCDHLQGSGHKSRHPCPWVPSSRSMLGCSFATACCICLVLHDGAFARHLAACLDLSLAAWPGD